MARVKIKIGCDPEVFLRDNKTGRVVSAHDLLPGTKIEPHKVDHGAIQVDGVAAEFNILPSTSPGEFTTYLSSVGRNIQSMIGDGFSLMAKPAVTFDPEYFKSLPDHVRELGCNPDYNAWTGQVNPKPDGETTMRTGAGHIHVSWYDKLVDPLDPIHFEDCVIITRQLDYYLGMYSLMWDNDVDRRKLYGCAGAFRPKPYGLEYRTLSNRWLASQTLQQWVWNATYKACQDLFEQKFKAEETFKDSARDAINDSVVWWQDPPKKYSKLSKLLHTTGLGKPPKISEDVVLDFSSKSKYIAMFRHLSANLYYGVDKNGQILSSTSDTFTKKAAEDFGLPIVESLKEISRILKDRDEEF